MNNKYHYINTILIIYKYLLYCQNNNSHNDNSF